MRPRLQQTAHVSRPALTDALPCWYDGPREVRATEEEEREREREEARGEGGAATATTAASDEKTKTKKNTSRPRVLPGIYAMPTPGVGYKLGLDAPVRFIGGGGGGGEKDSEEDDEEEAFESRVPFDDFCREPSAGNSAALEARAREFLPGLLLAASLSASSQSRVHSAQVCTWTDSPDGRFIIDSLAEGRVVVAAGCSGEGFKFSALMGLLLADLAEGKQPDEDVASFGLRRFEGMMVEGMEARGRHVLGR